MTIAFFLTPKSEVVCLEEGMTLRQVMEKMERYRYQAVPITDSIGKYLGVITEGDILWAMKRNPKWNFFDTEKVLISDIPRYWQYQPVTIGASMEDLIHAAGVQSFVPVVDDGGYFSGIIKRSDIISYMFRKLGTEEV